MHRLRRAAVIAAVALLATGCGSGDDEEGGGSTTTAPAEAPEISEVEGCGDEAHTDLQPDPDGVSLHCDAGAPAAQPLDEPTTLTFSIPSLTSEYALPIVLAQEFGEFEKENLTIEIETLPPNDALQLLAQGEIDIAANGLTVALFNAVAQDFNVRGVAAGYYASPENQAGLWARGSDVELADLEGMSIASGAGIGSPNTPYLVEALAEEGLAVDDVDIQQLPLPDIPQAFRDGGVDAAYLLDPFWLEFADDDEYSFVLPGTPPGEPVGLLAYGPTLLDEDRAAGEAFMRAYVRTVSTYLSEPDYRNGEYQEEIGEAIEATDLYFDGPGNVWDWEIKDGTIAMFQEVFLDLGVLEYTEPLPDEDIMDVSFLEVVIGHEY